MTIRTEFGYFFEYSKKSLGRFGVEMEVETKSLGDYDGLVEHVEEDDYCMTVPLPEWIVTYDHSLRNCGLEFVFKRPLDLSDAKVALIDWGDAFNDVTFIPDAPGTSTHVHVNFLDEELTTLANFLTLWTLFENILVDFSGVTRRSNLFALPSRVAEGVTRNLKDFLRSLDKTSPMVPSEQAAKYGAINICPLGRFGSVEIRSFRGTTDVNEIIEWLEILDKLVEAARSFSDPYECLEAWRVMGVDMVYSIFDEKATILLRDISDPVFYVERNLGYAMKLATSREDWSDFDTSVSKRLESTKKGRKKLALDGAQIEQYTLSDVLSGISPSSITTDEYSHIIEDSDDSEF